MQGKPKVSYGRFVCIQTKICICCLSSHSEYDSYHGCGHKVSEGYTKLSSEDYRGAICYGWLCVVPQFIYTLVWVVNLILVESRD
jgi:hypothetical protein